MRALFLVTWVLALAAASGAQTKQQIRVEQEVYAYQQGGMLTAPGSEPVLAGMIGADGRMGLLNVTGKPFSGTELRRTAQLLANGARIENSDSNQLYRDDQGRTRIEQTFEGRTTVVIMDPVAHFVAVLDRNSKTVHKNTIPADAMNGDVSVANGKVMVRLGSTKTAKEILVGHSASGTNVEARAGSNEKFAVPRVVVEDLGEKALSNVMARGTRETRILPAGAIGNDRDLEIVDERWFSPDLQLVVKSVNSDPRFGETTYQLTNIVRLPQDPALFQIPADYTVTENTHVALPEMRVGK